MSDKCEVDKAGWNGPNLCGASATHVVVASDGTVLGYVCRKHAALDYGEEQWQRQHFLQGCSQRSLNEGLEWAVQLEPLFCESCRQRLSTQKYPGRRCSECMRAVMLTAASKEQTAAIVALREAMVRIEERAITMAREHDMGTTTTTVQKNESIIDRASAVAAAVGVNDMALRAAARQIRKLAKAPLVAGLKARLSVKNPREFTRAVTAFLDSELGDAALSVALGGIIRYAPFVPEEYRDRLSHELVVDGGAAALDFAAEIVMAPVRDALAGASGLLANPNVANALRDGGIKVENVSAEKVSA